MASRWIIFTLSVSPIPLAVAVNALKSEEEWIACITTAVPAVAKIYLKEDPFTVFVLLSSDRGIGSLPIVLCNGISNQLDNLPYEGALSGPVSVQVESQVPVRQEEGYGLVGANPHKLQVYPHLTPQPIVPAAPSLQALMDIPYDIFTVTPVELARKATDEAALGFHWFVMYSIVDSSYESTGPFLKFSM